MRAAAAEQAAGPPAVPEGSALALLSAAQGLYFLITGIWPILNRRSFEWVTGPKADFWLVRAVGALIAVIGAVLLLFAWRGRPGPETVALGAGSAGALLAVDLNYALRGRISKVYLLDALGEAALLALWAAAAMVEQPSRRMRFQHRIETAAGASVGPA